MRRPVARALGAIPIGTTPMTEVGPDTDRLQRPSNDAAEPPLSRLHRGGLVHGIGRGRRDGARSVCSRRGRRWVDPHSGRAERRLRDQAHLGSGESARGHVDGVRLSSRAAGVVDVLDLRALAPRRWGRLIRTTRRPTAAPAMPSGLARARARAWRQRAAHRDRRARVARRRARRVEGVRGGRAGAPERAGSEDRFEVQIPLARFRACHRLRDHRGGGARRPCGQNGGTTAAR